MEEKVGDGVAGTVSQGSAQLLLASLLDTPQFT